MKALLIPTEGEAQLIEIEGRHGGLDALQAAVGGHIEAVGFPAEGVAAYIHEEGKLVGLPKNPHATKMVEGLQLGDYIAGPMVVAGLDEDGETVEVPPLAVFYAAKFLPLGEGCAPLYYEGKRQAAEEGWAEFTEADARRAGRADLTAIYREDATHEETVAAFQALIDSGAAWTMDGSTGRTAMMLIERGDCVLGEEGHRDYWGNYVPSRHEVEPGTKGSPEYAAERADD